jgi:hypothetical protein
LFCFNFNVFVVLASFEGLKVVFIKYCWSGVTLRLIFFRSYPGKRIGRFTRPMYWKWWASSVYIGGSTNLQEYGGSLSLPLSLEVNWLGKIKKKKARETFTGLKWLLHVNFNCLFCSVNFHYFIMVHLKFKW